MVLTLAYCKKQNAKYFYILTIWDLVNKISGEPQNYSFWGGFFLLSFAIVFDNFLGKQLCDRMVLTRGMHMFEGIKLYKYIF